MKNIKHPVLKGYVKSNGFFYPNSLLSRSDTVRRIISIWEPGSNVYHSESGYILITSRSRWVNCHRVGGAPLVKQGEVYTSGIFTDAEIEAIAPTANAVLVVEKGSCRVVACTPDRLEQPDEWINTSDYEVIDDMVSIGSPPKPPELKIEPVKKSLDSILEQPMPIAVPERDAVLSRFDEQKSSSKSSRLTRWAHSFFQWLSGKNQAARSSIQTAEPSQPALRRPKTHSMKIHLSSFLRLTGLWYFFSNLQSRYFKKMIDLFEDGDLQNALRHAIPLNKTGEMARDLPAWLNPKPRQHLKISASKATDGGTYHFEDAIYNYIQQLYEQAFSRLDRAGRIEEAVFVIAELLQDSERAVSYLERNKRLAAAAELAESRGLAPGLVVRQWFIAGNIERAISIARRTGAFKEAVVLLEGTHSDLSVVLRLLWAKHLAQAGNYVEAVLVAWKVKDARSLAESWIERAIDFGGIDGARLLAHRVILNPDTFTDTCNRLTTILEKDDTSHVIARKEFASTLLRLPSNPETRALGRLIFRPLLRDRASPKTMWPRKRFEELLGLIKDGALKADFQSIHFPEGVQDPDVVSLDQYEPFKKMVFSNFGSTGIYDVCVLPRERFLVALGEAGCQVINRQGKVLSHFNVPAHALAVSDMHNRAIALSHRGDIYRISRIYVDERKAEFWQDAKLDAYADTYDGSVWFAAVAGRLFAVDVQDKSFTLLWSVSNLPGTPLIIARSIDSLSTVIREADGQISLWRYELPGLMLRHRGFIETFQDQNTQILGISAQGTVGVVDTGQVSEERLVLNYAQMNLNDKQIEKRLDLCPGLIHPAEYSGKWCAVRIENKKGCTVYLFDQKEFRVRLCLELVRTKHAKIRFLSEELVICDDQGRIIRIDLNYGAIVYSLCL